MILGDVPLKKQIFSIPNLMGYFRIILIPVILWRYLTAESIGDYRMAAVFMGISGITDFLDGFVARKFHMVTQLGKAVDPIADKLTQVAIVCALSGISDHCRDPDRKRRIHARYGIHINEKR